MDFPFTHDLTVDGTIVAQIEGVALIESDPLNTHAGRTTPEWSVESIELYSVDASDRFARVTLPEDDPLHDKILLRLLQRRRAEIDEAWRAHMLEAIGAARARFLPPRPVPAAG